MPRKIGVLLVEDDFIVREFVQASLEDAGLEVLTADHGGEAIHLLERHDDPVQVLVTDVRLGEGPDGWAVARYARRLRPELPIVYFSGQSARDWPCEGVPKSTFLQKPFAPAQIIAAVRDALPPTVEWPTGNP